MPKKKARSVLDLAADEHLAPGPDWSRWASPGGVGALSGGGGLIMLGANEPAAAAR